MYVCDDGNTLKSVKGENADHRIKVGHDMDHDTKQSRRSQTL